MPRAPFLIHLTALVACFVWIAASPLVVVAQSGAVTFDEALSLGEASPAVEARRRELAAREARSDGMGGTAQATTLTFMPGAVLNPDLVQGFDAQVSLTQGWNLAGLGGARRRAAREEREVISAEIRARALRARLEAARRWIELSTRQAVEELLGAQGILARERLDHAERALAGGVGRAMDVADARAEAVDLDRRRLDVEGERVWAANQLAVAMGRPSSEGLRADGPLPAPGLPDEGTIRSRLEDIDALPELAVRRLAASAARAREEEAHAQYAPILTLGGQLERGSLGSWTAYGIASFSMNAFGQDGRSVAVAHAAAAREDAELDVARVRARADLEDALHEVEHSRRQLTNIIEELLPALNDLLQRRERALAAGEATIFVLLDARHRSLVAEEARVRAEGAKAWAEVRLWLLLSELEGGGDA